MCAELKLLLFNSMYGFLFFFSLLSVADIAFKFITKFILFFQLLTFISLSLMTTLGTRGFSRVRREFSVLAEGRHVLLFDFDEYFII